MKPSMSPDDAWRALGKNPMDIYGKLSRTPKSERAKEAARDLDLARKLSQALMKVYHPDKGGDPESFKVVNSAIQSLEYYIKEYISELDKIDRCDDTTEIIIIK